MADAAFLINPAAAAARNIRRGNEIIRQQQAEERRIAKADELRALQRTQQLQDQALEAGVDPTGLTDDALLSQIAPSAQARRDAATRERLAFSMAAQGIEIPQGFDVPNRDLFSAIAQAKSDERAFNNGVKRAEVLMRLDPLLGKQELARATGVDLASIPAHRESGVEEGYQNVLSVFRNPQASNEDKQEALAAYEIAYSGNPSNKAKFDASAKALGRMLKADKKDQAAILSQSNTLRKEYQKNVKEYYTKRAAAEDIAEFAKNPSAFSTTAAVFRFLKVLDPTSTIREGEYDKIQATQGWDSRFQGMFDRARAGLQLTPSQLRDMQKTTEQLLSSAQKIRDEFRVNYEELARLQGIPNTFVVGLDDQAIKIARAQYSSDFTTPFRNDRQQTDPFQQIEILGAGEQHRDPKLLFSSGQPLQTELPVQQDPVTGPVVQPAAATPAPGIQIFTPGQGTIDLGAGLELPPVPNALNPSPLELPQQQPFRPQVNIVR